MTDGSARTLKTLVEGGTFFEGPRWHDGRWWVSDFYRHQVLAVTTDGKEETVLTVEQQPSGLGWMPDGSMIVVSMLDRRLLRHDPASGKTEQHADLSQLAGGHVNDMVVDRKGHAYVGNFGFDLMAGEQPRPAALIHVDPEGTASIAAEDMQFPNGSVVTEDGSTLIVGETMGGRYTAFDIADDGSLANRRIWAQLEGAGPDGCGLDAENHIWAADALNGRCIRVAEGGAIVDEARPPEGLGVYACMLGGDDGRTLLMCCAPDYFEHNRREKREALLVTTTVDVPRAGLP